MGQLLKYILIEIYLKDHSFAISGVYLDPPRVGKIKHLPHLSKVYKAPNIQRCLGERGKSVRLYLDHV